MIFSAGRAGGGGAGVGVVGVGVGGVVCVCGWVWWGGGGGGQLLGLPTVFGIKSENGGIEKSKKWSTINDQHPKIFFSTLSSLFLVLIVDRWDSHIIYNKHHGRGPSPAPPPHPPALGEFYCHRGVVYVFKGKCGVQI